MGGVPRDPSRQLSDQVLDLMQEGKLALPEMEGLLKDAGLSFTDFAEQLFRGGVRRVAWPISAGWRRRSANGAPSRLKRPPSWMP